MNDTNARTLEALKNTPTINSLEFVVPILAKLHIDQNNTGNLPKENRQALHEIASEAFEEMCDWALKEPKNFQKAIIEAQQFRPDVLEVLTVVKNTIGDHHE